MNALNLKTTSLPTSKTIVLLTEKEKEILYLIAHEYSDKEIGSMLYLSHHTVHSYRKKLMLKLEVTKSTGLVRRGYELGILPYHRKDV